MARDRRRRGLVRTRTETVFGNPVAVIEHMDPEIEGRVENGWTQLSPRDLDAMRVAEKGEQYVPIEEAERRRKARPAKKAARKMDLGSALLRLARAAAKDDLDHVGAANLDEIEELDDEELEKE